MKVFSPLKSIILISFFVFSSTTFAANPPQPFLPGDNIQDPGCLPTDSNCYVLLTSFQNEDVEGLDYATSTGILSLTSGYNIPTTASTTAWNTAIGALGGSALLQNGNSFGNTLTLGTNDNNALSFETNNNTAITILANGNVGVGTTTPSEKISISGNAYVDGFALASYFYTSSSTATSTFSNVIMDSIAQGVRVTYPDGQMRFFKPSSNTNTARGQALLSAVSASTASTTVDIGPGDYLLTSPINILNGQTYRLNGSRIYHTVSENSQMMFNVSGVHDWSMYGPGTIEGSGFGTGATEVGLNTQSSYRWRIDGITFRGFKNTGLQVNNSNYGVGDKFPTGQITNIVFEYNNIGTYVGAGAEFIEWTNITWTRNNTGLQLFAGNNQFFNSNMLQNVNFGLRLYATGSGNHGHGKWVGGSFGHNPGTSLWVEQNFVWGFTFVGTHFYGDTSTSGWLDLSGRGIRFNGGNLDAPIKASSTPTGIHVFQDMYIAGNNATTTALSTTSRSMIKFYQNQTDNGPWIFNDAISVSDGGTGLLYLTPGSVLLGNGSSTISTSTALYVDNLNSFVGIGTSTPSTKLDVWGSLKVGTSSVPALYVNSLTGNVGIGTLNPISSFTRTLQITGSGSAAISLDNGGSKKYSFGVTGTNSLGFYDETLSAYRLLIDSSGNIGIGTTTPVSKISLSAGQIEVPSGSVSAPGYSFGGDLNTGMYQAAANQLDFTVNGFNFISISSAGTIFMTQSPSLRGGGGTATNPFFTFSGDPSTGMYKSIGSNLGFSTGGTERLRIDSTGNVGIGTTTPADRLQVFGDVRLGTTGTNGCIKDFGGTGITGTCSSDERLKTNIVDLSDGYLDKMNNLKLITYNWNNEANTLNKVDTTVTNYGLLAQNVEAIFPELASVDSNGYKQVNYSRIPLYLLKAVQELSKKVSGIFDGTAEIDVKKVKSEQLCVGDTCVSEAQLKALLQGQNIQPTVYVPEVTPPAVEEVVVEDEVVEEIIVEEVDQPEVVVEQPIIEPTPDPVVTPEPTPEPVDTTPTD